MQAEKITEEQLEAFDALQRETLTALVYYPEVARLAPPDPGKQLYEQIMDAAAALKTYGSTYVDIDIVLDHAAERVGRHMPAAAVEDARRRVCQYLKAA